MWGKCGRGVEIFYRKPHPLPLPRREGSGMICLLKWRRSPASAARDNCVDVL